MGVYGDEGHMGDTYGRDVKGDMEGVRVSIAGARGNKESSGTGNTWREVRGAWGDTEQRRVMRNGCGTGDTGGKWQGGDVRRHGG